MLKTTIELKHAVRTSFGDYNNTFGSKDWYYLEAMYGIGQMNGAGPSIWVVVSSILYDYQREAEFNKSLFFPKHQILKEYLGYTY